MKLRRLKILKFRNVQPGTELEFNDDYSVLLGQNGSGKTTLLRLITSVLRGDFVWLQREAFALEAELRAHGTQVTLAVANEQRHPDDSDFEVSAINRRALIPKPDRWFATASCRIVDSAGGIWEWRQDENGREITTPELVKGKLLQQTRTRFKSPSLLHPLEAGIPYLLAKSGVPQDKPMQCVTDLRNFLEQYRRLAYAWRFDESLELFSAMTGRVSSLGKQEFGEITGRITVNLEGLDSDRNLLPLEFKAIDALRSPNFDASADTINLKHDQAPFLAKVMQMLGYVGAEIKLDLLGKEVTEAEKKIEYGNLRFFFHGRDGSIVNQDYLSYGQKRLLTFFYYLACNPHVVVADELVNGLHHAWIAECMREMGDRQVFVTSQNPILLDHLGFDSTDHVHRTFITCQAKPEGVRDRIVWANMSKKNAESFYRAYKVGAQHVGEILRTKGFW